MHRIDHRKPIAVDRPHGFIALMQAVNMCS